MRVCTATGLTLIETPQVGYRITKSSYGPLNPQQRTAGAVDRSQWSRFDTPGRTVYLSDTRRTAFAETLAFARVDILFASAAVHAAETFGISLQEAKDDIEADWIRSGQMHPGWLPASWRDGRLIHDLWVDDPSRWVDLTTQESLAALQRGIGPTLNSRLGIEAVTLGVLTGENREATTLIAEWIRAQVLDDGNYAAGVYFHSKFGGGGCWAYWMRRTDEGFGADPIRVISTSEIKNDDPDLTYVLNLYGASCR